MCAHTQNEKHKTLNSPCAHKGVSNTTAAGLLDKHGNKKMALMTSVDKRH